MRLCCAQFSPEWGEVSKNLARAEGMIADASRSNADLICFPEQFATGWSPAPEQEPEDTGGKIVSALRRMAKSHSIAVLGGFLEKYSPRPRNTAILVGSDGEPLCTYAKMHPYTPGGEDRFITPGESLASAKLGGVRIGIAICYDLRFPMLFRRYAEAGAELVLVQAAWPCRRSKHWEIFLMARALENQFYVAGVNCTGRTPIEEYCGRSMVIDPFGEAVAESGGSEELLFADIEADTVESAREAFPHFRGGEQR